MSGWLDVTLASPWALGALASLPILVAIYLLRRRYRRQPVSSLLLWRDQPDQREGGRRVDRLRMPPSMWLELLILALLAVAAAAPLLRTGDAEIPLAVVLDDSFSMRAGEISVNALPVSEADASPRLRAIEALSELLTTGGYRPVQLVLAGEVPQSLGTLPLQLERLDGGFEADAVRRYLDERWTAGSATARLEPAVALAHDLVGNLAGTEGRVLILTDHPPAEEPASQRWWSFGRPSANLALTQAVRSQAGVLSSAETAGDEDSCLVELVYFAPASGTEAAVPSLDAVLDVDVEGQPRRRLDAQLTSGEPRLLRLPVAAGRAVELHLRAAGAPAAVDNQAEERARNSEIDALQMDSQALLLPEPLRGVRVELDIGDERAHQLFRRALEASGRALLRQASSESGEPAATVNEVEPRLRITDRAPSQAAQVDATDATTAGASSWILRLRRDADAVSYLGPFVLDRGHPLTDGLALGGVIWGAGRAEGPGVLPGRALISAGDVPLLSDLETAGGGHELTLRLRADLSNLDRAPDWPVLMWNLLAWRAGEAEGLEHANVRLGDAARLRVPAGFEEDIRVTSPDGLVRDLPAPVGRVLRLPADRPGLHQVSAGQLQTRFAVNTLDAGESDLRRAATGRWGNWSGGVGTGDGVGDWRYRSYAWLLLLLVLALLLLHGGLFLSSGASPTDRNAPGRDAAPRAGRIRA